MLNSRAGANAPAIRIAKPTAVLLLAAGIVWYAQQQREEQPAPAAFSQKTDVVANDGPGDVPGVSSRLRKLSAQGGGRSDRVGGIAPAGRPDFSPLHSGLAGMSAKRADRDRMVVELETRHQAESVDSTWASQSELSILRAVADPVMLQEKFTPNNLAADCRSKSCRISASFAGSGDAVDWADRLVTQMGPTLSPVRITIIQQPDGRSEVRMYGTRKPQQRG